MQMLFAKRPKSGFMPKPQKIILAIVIALMILFFVIGRLTQQ